MTNRLSLSTSPYLQQHAENPVDWHEWGAEALQLSQSTGKPILLSIGYSACHWCHVMAHESFEDEETARIMNALFINIKVDREERPDIDQIYQTAHAMLTERSGGWPLTMFLTPDTTPFFGGTYFPKTARYGLPGFRDLLGRVSHHYQEKPKEIAEQNERMRAALAQRHEAKPLADIRLSADSLTREPIDAAIHMIARSFDARLGGFGRAPKFPHPEMMEFCLRRFAESGNVDARHMALFTLEAMCKGGIFDQLGGGFARYSVDEEWAIPHFEKMLYDNGPLLRLLADASLIASNSKQSKEFGRCMDATAAWVLREMQSPAGGYYSTLDADSEGHEGKFYVWTPAEVEALLTDEEWQVAKTHWGLDRAANFENHFWNFIVAAPVAEADAALIESARAKLFAARKLRIHPGRDEKILTSWNALMIEGMARAARVSGRADWLASAERALTFVRATMWDATRQRLYATHKDGKTHLNAYLDDYAFLFKAILEILQARFSTADLSFACALADVLLEQFEDKDHGGFFFTSHDHEALIQRPKPGFDNATPSGNGIAALALIRLSHITGETRYADAAERALIFFADAMADHPSGHGTLLMALEEFLNPTTLVILAGEANELTRWQVQLGQQFLPTTITLTIPNGTPGVPFALTRPATSPVNAYVCQGVTCLAPIADVETLLATLNPLIVRG